jgi:hypothetical protein
MRSFHNSSFDPQTLVLLERAFDEAWLTLKSVGNKTVKPDELARSVLRTAMEGERDPVRLHDGALEQLLPATTWREASWLPGLATRRDPEQWSRRPVLQQSRAAGTLSSKRLTQEINGLMTKRTSQEQAPMSLIGLKLPSDEHCPMSDIEAWTDSSRISR